MLNRLASKPIQGSLAVYGLVNLTHPRRMKARVMFALIAALLANKASVVSAANSKIRTLIITGGQGFEKEAFFDVFKSNPPIAFTNAAQGKASADAYEREDLLSYDVVVLYDMPKNITDAQKAKFVSLFDRGIGLVVLHHALVSYQHWPEYERII